MSGSRSVSRRRFLGGSGAALAGLALSRRPLVEAAPRFDLVLEGGTLIDGTGGAAYPGDLGIVGDSIEAIERSGTISEGQAARVLDVTGLHVSPGFIDIHTHSDGSILAYPTADSRVCQGVTTELVGNCGSSVAPLVGNGDEELHEQLKEDGIEPDWSNVASYLERLERHGISINQALLLGQGTLRANTVGLADRSLTATELEAVLRAVEEGLEQGAFGLSTGLEYTPGRYTPTDEIVALARRVARRGGLYASHIRNEEAALLEAVDEAIAVGRRSGARVEVSHLKAAGRPNWGKQQAALDLIEAARRDGVEVLADAYPYTAYSTSLTIQLPDWALEGGVEPMLARLGDRESRARIRTEVAARIAGDPGDYDLIVISRVRTATNNGLVGSNLVEIGRTWGLEPVDAALRLIEEERGAVGFIGHGMSEANVEQVLAHPLVMIGSDGSSMAPVGRAAETRPHPRSYGAFARVLGLYVRERGLFDLETAIRKMTSQPADQIGLRDRGRLAPGQKADLAVFDARRVQDEASFESPHRYASGIVHVLVNGRLVIEGGGHTGARPGRALRKG